MFRRSPSSDDASYPAQRVAVEFLEPDESDESGGALPSRTQSNRTRARLRTRAWVGITLIALMYSGASPSAAARPASAAARFIDRGGPVLRTAQIYLLYWGSAWAITAQLSPTPDQITAAFKTVVAGPYLSGLAQYRDIDKPVLAQAAVITSSNPPTHFTNKTVTNFLDTQLNTGELPGPGPDNQPLYIVMLPVGTYIRGDSGLVGEHNSYPRHGQQIHYAWTANSDRLPNATWIMSHELVESLTDPQGSAVLGAHGTCLWTGWCEIADICRSIGIVDGIAVNPYWSNLAHACVTPGTLATRSAP
jgi:hypothetical protein